MFIYYLPIILGLFGFLLIPKSKIYFYICLFILFLLLGFKGPIDKDYYNYIYLLDYAPIFGEGFFQEFLVYMISMRFEPGFLFLNSIAKSLGFGITFIYLSISLFSCLTIGIVCNLLRINRFLLFIFLYTISFLGLWVQIRFGLACLLSLLAAILFINKRTDLALLVICFSILFHNSTVIVLLSFLIYYLVKSRYLNRYLLLAIIILSSIGFSVFNVKLLLLSIFSFFSDRYEAYSETNGGVFSFYSRLLLFIFLFVLIRGFRFIDGDVKRILLSFTVASLVIWSVAWRIDVLYRLGVLLEFGLCLFMMRSCYAGILRYRVGVSIVLLIFSWRFVVATQELLPYSLSSTF